jgi:hypothetical protein
VISRRSPKLTPSRAAGSFIGYWGSVGPMRIGCPLCCAHNGLRRTPDRIERNVGAGLTAVAFDLKPAITTVETLSDGRLTNICASVPACAFLVFQHQHPLSDPPAIPLRLAEPPSDDGTGGGHIGEAAPGAVAVVLGACMEVPGFSPGNSRGA